MNNLLLLSLCISPSFQTRRFLDLSNHDIRYFRALKLTKLKEEGFLLWYLHVRNEDEFALLYILLVFFIIGVVFICVVCMLAKRCFDEFRNDGPDYITIEMLDKAIEKME